MNVKECHKCGNKKPLTEFNQNHSRKDGLQARCRECDQELGKANYPKYRSKHIVRSLARTKEIRQWFTELKQQKCCERCGDKRWYVLDFHHKESDTKFLEISAMVSRCFSRAKILAEITKCCVLCANCHREIHYLEDKEDNLI